MEQILRRMGEVWGGADPTFLGLAIGCFCLGLLAGALRWKKILVGLGVPARFRKIFLGVTTAIFINNITPSSRLGGDFFRATWIVKDAGGWSKAVASVAYDRLINLTQALLTLLVALPTLFNVLPIGQRGLLIPAILLGLLIIGVVLGARSERCRRFVEKHRQLFRDMRLSSRAWLQAIGCSSLIWVTDLLRLAAIAAAFGVTLTLSQLAFVGLGLHVGSLSPTVGGLGVTEGTMTLGLKLLKVPLETALVMMLAERSISYLLSTALGGLLAFLTGGWKLIKKLKKPNKNSHLGPAGTLGCKNPAPDR